MLSVRSVKDEAVETWDHLAELLKYVESPYSNNKEGRNYVTVLSS